MHDTTVITQSHSVEVLRISQFYRGILLL